MAVDVRTSELSSNISVAAVSGRLDLLTTQADSPAVLQALEETTDAMIVDMDAVDFISSSGLRMLLAARENAEANGKKLAVIRTKPLVYKIFKVSGLDQVFRFFESEAEAVKALEA